MSAEEQVMQTVELDVASFEQKLSGGGMMLIDFWASWCAPCRAFAPTFEKAAGAHPDITFGKVDTEAVPLLAQAFGVRAIPTLVAIKDGNVVYANPGALPMKSLEELIAKLRALDVSKLPEAPGSAKR